jgi:hypothetical protein
MDVPDLSSSSVASTGFSGFSVFVVASGVASVLLQGPRFFVSQASDFVSAASVFVSSSFLSAASPFTAGLTLRFSAAAFARSLILASFKLIRWRIRGKKEIEGG